MATFPHQIPALKCPQIEVFQADITREEQLSALAAAMGEVDLLVNNAGICILAPFLEAKMEDCEAFEFID